MTDNNCDQETPTGPTIDHHSYLGGSDIAAVLGVNPYKTALDVWAEKVHGLEQKDSGPMSVGKVLERPVLRELYAEPRKLWLFFPGTHVHPSEPWMGSTPDACAGIIDLDIDRLAECKIVGAHQMKRWGPEEEGPDGIPPEVLTQATWQLEAVRAAAEPLESCDVVALLGTEIRVYGIAYDATLAADLMETGRKWWKRHVENREMPEIYSEDTRKLLSKIHATPVEGILEMREDVRTLAQGWLTASSEEEAAAEIKDNLAARICTLIAAQNARGFESDRLKVDWYPRKGSIAYKAIVDSLGVPEAKREEYRGDPTRVFRVTEKGKEK